MNAMLPINQLPIDMLLQQYSDSAVNLTTDTRQLQSGDVFLAYPVGNNRQSTDNRSYIAEALNLGASLVLYESEGISDDLKVVCSDKRCVAVKDLAKNAGLIASEWYQSPSQKMRVVGVTGTNGKTTVSQWIAEALNTNSCPSGVIGTLGAGLLNHTSSTGFTTPDAPKLQALIHEIQVKGAKSLAMEVSSHALDQGRINGVQFDTVVVTNLTQDHLDYHGSMNEYAAAKKKILDLPGIKRIVINADDPFGRDCLAYLANKVTNDEIAVWAYATHAENLLGLPCFANQSYQKILASDIQLVKQGMSFNLTVSGEDLGTVQTQFVGAFNVSNALAVLGTLLAGGMDVHSSKSAIEHLKPVKGRMELVSSVSQSTPMAIIDFAHTPDALEQVLKTLKVLAKNRNGQLWCVFGCGGNRDASKRPIMGRIAEALAGHVVVTSDNPRNEDPEQIIADILSGMSEPSKAHTNADRATAILHAIRQAKSEDIVLIAGKGHEETQEIAGKKHSFSDQVHVQLAMGGLAL